MADNVTIPTTGTGDATPVIATDNISSVHYQRVKHALGPDGTYTADQDGTAARGAYVDPRLLLVRIAVTPTVSTTPAYTAKDCIGAGMTFANAVRASGGTGTVLAVQVQDNAQQKKDMDLLLFDRAIGATTDNAIFAPSNSDLGFCLGVIPIPAGAYADLSANCVAAVNNVGLGFVLNGTSLFGQLVARDTPTFAATSNIVVTITIQQD